MPTQGDRIRGRYELTRPISSGGMGQVWQGYDIVLDRQVAVKVIRPGVAADRLEAEELAARFRREARITARIEHPGVPAVFDADIDGDHEQLYLVMQLVRGVPLGDLIEEEGPLPVATAAAVAAQICTVLSYAHAVPVIHRDLKPGNVMVAEDGSVKVLDFGIAAVLRTDTTRLTATGRRLGTCAYMPPEQVRGGVAGPASDLYSLGCMLYELLTGHRVFPGDSDYEVMDHHVRTAPRPVRDLRPDVPAALDDLVLHLLAKNPEERPAGAQDVHDRLVPFLPAPDPAAADALPPPGGLPDPTRPYRRPLAPRPRPDGAAPRRPAPARPAQPDHQAPSLPTLPSVEELEDELAEVAEHVEILIEEERYAQAAGVLDEVLDRAVPCLGAAHRDVVELRLSRAVALSLGGDHRRALPEYRELADHFAAAEGPDSERALLCRQQAALCRAQLGESTAALREFQELLTRVAPVRGDRDQMALELRLEIGRLLLYTGRVAEARRRLGAVHADLAAALGPGDPLTREAADLLARLGRDRA